MLAALLLRLGRPVPLTGLIDALWGNDPPMGAVTVLRTYVSRLRKVLEPGRLPGEAPQVLVSAADGYLIRIPEDAIDLAVFERRVTEAKKLRVTGDPASARELLHSAQDLWQGRPLAGLPGPLAEVERYRLDEAWLTALETRLDIDLELGRHEEVSAEVASLTREHPHRERLCELRMLALYRCGRQAEALAAYRRLRDTMVAELGMEPGPALLELHARLLDGDPSLREAVALPERPATGPAQGTVPARPAQLPADLSVFTGRSGELAQTHALLDAGSTSPDAVVISAIGGMAGVGKTALAVRWAHEVAHRYPDGQLYVNLRGFDPTNSALDPDEVIHTFLDALGVHPQQIPAHPDARAALYRSLLADRRMLVLLDNARDTEQVRPLLPSGPGCLVIVTSRNQLTGLIANEGVRPLTLGPLPLAEAHDFLARRIGAERLAAEPDAADAITKLTARLPLALAIVAARAATNPTFPLSAVVDELCESHGSLDAFAGGDITTDARAVFSWSYRALTAPAARMFKLLALHPGPEISMQAAAALAGLTPRETRVLLAELTHAHLLSEHAPGRFAFHDLLRVYAAERAEDDEAQEEHDEAVERVLAWYLRSTDAASQLLAPNRPRPPLSPLPAYCRPRRFTSYDQALNWCTDERVNLIAAIQLSATAERAGIAWRLTGLLWGFFYLRNHTNDWAATNRTGLSAAREAGDLPGEIECLTGLGNALAVAGRYEESMASYREALPLCERIGDLQTASRVVGNLGDVCLRAGRLREAIDYCHRALEMDRTRGERWGEGICLNNLGEAHLRLGLLDEAADFLQQGLTVQRAIGNNWVEGVTLDFLGTVHHRLGRQDEAVAFYHSALEAHRNVGNRWGEAHTLSHLADVKLAVGQPEAARTGLDQAVRTLEAFGHPDADAIRERLRELDSCTGPLETTGPE